MRGHGRGVLRHKSAILRFQYTRGKFLYITAKIKKINKTHHHYVMLIGTKLRPQFRTAMLQVRSHKHPVVRSNDSYLVFSMSTLHFCKCCDTNWSHNRRVSNGNVSHLGNVIGSPPYHVFTLLRNEKKITISHITAHRVTELWKICTIWLKAWWRFCNPTRIYKSQITPDLV